MKNTISAIGVPGGRQVWSPGCRATTDRIGRRNIRFRLEPAKVQILNYTRRPLRLEGACTYWTTLHPAWCNDEDLQHSFDLLSSG